MQMPKIAKFSYAGRDVEVRVRDGYVNITQLCRVERKRARDLLRGKDYHAFVEVVAGKAHICASSLVEKRHGGRQGGEIWSHPLIASWVAERLSPEAAFFIHATLRDLHLAGVVVEIAERQSERVAPVAEPTNKNDRHDFPLAIKVEYDHIVVKHYGGACPNCGERAEVWHYDHFWSRTNNLVSAGWKICGPCNLKKTGKLSFKQNGSWLKRFVAFQNFVVQAELF